MKKSKFTEEQIAFALHQAEMGTSVEEVCRKIGIAQATFYAWKKKYGGKAVSLLQIPVRTRHRIDLTQQLVNNAIHTDTELFFFLACLLGGSTAEQPLLKRH